MRRQDFFYHLPPELIAQYPASPRTASRLLYFKRQTEAYQHGLFTQVLDLLNPGDILVLNDTQVIPARLYGRKASGGQVEVFLERIVDTQRILAQIRASKAPSLGSCITIQPPSAAHLPPVKLEVLARQGGFFELAVLGDQAVLPVLQAYGHVPLPPYIQRPDQASDQACYQTVYAAQPGAVAAPTAGLHFDEALLQRLQAKGIALAFITLHVGAGTFQPMRVERIEEHVIHAEWMSLTPATVAKILAAKAEGGRVIAVGTTTVRCLESAAQQGVLKPFEGETRLFIYPGYLFQVVDAVITNFHLPESSLLMLVAAFAGYQPTLKAYQVAVEQRYRFYSYGDAMMMF